MQQPRYSRVLLLGALLLTAQLAAAEESGQDVFDNECGVCHSAVAGKTKLGPSLAGVVGRKAGTLPGYEFSDPMKASGVVWTPELLDQFVTNPQKMMPGIKMGYAGEEHADERALLVKYLGSLK